MSILAYTITYNRLDFLLRQVDHFNSHGINLTVVDDGSYYPPEQTQHFAFMTFQHEGKPGFWKRFDWCLRSAEQNMADIYIFIQDDFESLDIERVKAIHEELKDQPYIHHLINDGRQKCWTNIESVLEGERYRVGWIDTTFFCNRAALDKLGYYITDPLGWALNPKKSSGVGRQLTHRLPGRGINIFKPVKSLAYHGDHESLMHPEERKITKLISQ